MRTHGLKLTVETQSNLTYYIPNKGKQLAAEETSLSREQLLASSANTDYDTSSSLLYNVTSLSQTNASMVKGMRGQIFMHCRGALSLAEVCSTPLSNFRTLQRLLLRNNAWGKQDAVTKLSMVNRCQKASNLQ